jgi:tRNA modification GTPase
MLANLCGGVPASRKAALRMIRNSAGEVIDEGLVLWFPAPRSFTGEDVFELQVHGGPAVVEAALLAIDTLNGRLAEPGEFTRRAFEAERLDLAQAEAVADLVDAETDAQRRQALRQLGGELSKRGERWRDTFLSALAFLSAQIDFPDEDLPDHVAARALAPLRALAAEIEEVLVDVRGERIRDGLRIALIGGPNAGKSSLFNALVKRDAAIVTSTPGTTRDVIEASLMLSGFKVVLADTAGVRSTTDEIEREGVRRALDWAERADLRLWIIDPSTPDPNPELEALIKPRDILVLTKSDLYPVSKFPQMFERPTIGLVATSTVLGGGLDQLVESLGRWISTAMTGSDFPAVTRARHRHLLHQAHESLKRALNRSIDQAEMIAADVGLAMRAVESIAGRMDTEAVLDRVFQSFCIGK